MSVLRLRYRIAWLLSVIICEPQLRLGRRRHDGRCDTCREPIDRYGLERLYFDYDGDSPTDISSWEALRSMLTAEYECYCLYCDPGDE